MRCMVHFISRKWIETELWILTTPIVVVEKRNGDTNEGRMRTNSKQLQPLQSFWSRYLLRMTRDLRTHDLSSKWNGQNFLRLAAYQRLRVEIFEGEFLYKSVLHVRMSGKRKFACRYWYVWNGSVFVSLDCPRMAERKKKKNIVCM